MSYDLMVFDPAAAPQERAAFLAWFRAQTLWTEGHGYNDPVVSAPALRAWFLDMIRTFPAMNGPHAVNRDDESPGDYSVGRHVIYVAFAWSKAQEAYAAVRAFAEKHGVGFFDASSAMGQVWGPRPDGSWVLLHLDRDEDAKAKRREALVRWARTGDALPKDWGRTPEERLASAEESTAALQQERLRAYLTRNLATTAAVAEAARTWSQALLRVVSETSPNTPEDARRAVLLPSYANDRFRRLALGFGWTLFYPAPASGRDRWGLKLVTSGVMPEAPLSATKTELVEWLSRTNHGDPGKLANTLFCAAATAVLERDTAVHEGQFIEFRTVTQGPVQRADQISLTEARKVDASVKAGEELGFASNWDAWLFPLLDWLYESASS